MRPEETMKRRSAAAALDGGKWRRPVKSRPAKAQDNQYSR